MEAGIVSRDEFFRFNIGHILILIGWLATCAVGWGRYQSEMETVNRRLVILEDQSRRDSLESRSIIEKLSKVENDVSWIKNTLDQRLQK